MSQTAQVRPERARFYDKISAYEMAPLWEVLKNLVPAEPVSRAAPFRWKYDDVRPLIMEAGKLLTAKEAERRVLVLENPALRGESRITNTLYAGVQLILPGEVAPAHRHTQSALRFILEGDGAYTAVHGEKTIMREGDFVITPAWCWHDHGNETDRPMTWLDGLDVPLVAFFEGGFREEHDADRFPVSRQEGDSLARYGAGMLPEGYEASGLASPVFNYPYARTREALETMRREEAWDPHHGLKMRYVNPVDGSWAMPTIATWMQLLPRGFETQPYRSTDGTVYAVVEGKGRSTIGQETFDWGPRDVIVAPTWAWQRHEASEDAVLFSFSDRASQEKLGLWREQRGNA